MKILIADSSRPDGEELREAAVRLYPDALCVAAGDPREVMELFGRHRFDVVFIEAGFPGESGVRLAKRILEKAPVTNIIYVASDTSYAAECWTTFASAFLVKPLTEEMIRDAFAHLRHPVSNITDEMIEREFAGKGVIGKKIEKWREERGMSRQELADALSVELRTVYRWENAERSPDIATYLKILQVLGKSTDIV